MKCPKCKSAMTYIRISTGELVCRSCGTVTPKNEVEEIREVEELKKKPKDED